MKLLTFLGAPKQYYRTTYIWQEESFTSPYAPAATCHFLKPEEIIVFLTKTAREKFYNDFLDHLPDAVIKRSVFIPMGKDTQELWELFEIISSNVKPEEEVAFDITHGLRAFPYMSLLAAAFLRSGLNVKLNAVLYGAFEVRDRKTDPDRTPMFDLSPMIKLLEWASAADRFNRTGDARYLASLVQGQRKDLALAAQGNPDMLEEVGRLGNLAGALESISQSLRLLRPYQTMQSVAGLPERISLAKPALEHSVAHPFNLLLDSINQTYQPLGNADPGDEASVFLTLETERKMLHWYVERNQWVQAVSLAREWLISWVMAHLGLNNMTSTKDRARIEQTIGMEAGEWLEAKKGDGDEPFTPLFLGQLPKVEEVLNMWHQLTNTRNDIDHAAKRDKPLPMKPQALIRNIENCLGVIDGLPLEEIES